MSCHSEKKSNAAFDNELKVLLMGNPNVGKSVIFSKLTRNECYSIELYRNYRQFYKR